MKFSSIKEYFYKLYNICYLLTLIPLGVFIYLYMNMQAGKINILVQERNTILMLQIVVLAFATFFLTIVHLVIKKKMKVLSSKMGLGNKMDQYYYLSLIRIGSGAFVSSAIGLGLLYTGSEIFSVFFLGILLWMAFQWPTPKKMCVELKLKGDEKEMILYKRESL